MKTHFCLLTPEDTAAVSEATIRPVGAVSSTGVSSANNRHPPQRRTGERGGGGQGPAPEHQEQLD